MITCVELTELVSEYIEGRLSWWDRMRFWFHVRRCPVCLDYIRQMETTRALLGRLPDAPIPEPVLDEMMKAFHGWKRGEGVGSGAAGTRLEGEPG